MICTEARPRIVGRGWILPGRGAAGMLCGQHWPQLLLLVAWVHPQMLEEGCMSTKNQGMAGSSKTRVIVGWIEVATGIVGFFVVFIVSGVLIHTGEFSFLVLLVTVVPFLYLLAGIGVLKRIKGALVLSLTLQLAAILDIGWGGNFKWQWDPTLAISLSFSADGFVFGVDFLAIVMAIYILKIIKEQHAQATRAVDVNTATPFDAEPAPDSAGRSPGTRGSIRIE